MDRVETTEREQDEETVIDIKAFLVSLKYYWYVVLIGALVGTLVALLYATFLVTPMYESSSLVYIRGTSTTISLSDIQLSSELSEDYEIIFTSRPNLEATIEDLDLDYTASQLNSMVSISSPSDHILKIVVTADDPNVAKDITNTLVEKGVDMINEIDSQQPYVIEKGIANSVSVSTSSIVMSLMGLLVGLFIALGILFVKFVFSDTVTSVDEVERLLDLPVLAVVVEDKSLNYNKKRTRTKSKSKNKKK